MERARRRASGSERRPLSGSETRPAQPLGPTVFFLSLCRPRAPLRPRVCEGRAYRPESGRNETHRRHKIGSGRSLNVVRKVEWRVRTIFSLCHYSSFYFIRRIIHTFVQQTVSRRGSLMRLVWMWEACKRGQHNFYRYL